MRNDCTIGLVQMDSIVGKTERNYSKIIELAHDAKAKGVSILCYPEMALHGYSPGYASELAQSLSDQAIKEIGQCAQDLDIVLLVGLAEINPDSAKPFLSQLIAFPDGRVDVYRKVHLGRSELPYFTPGDSFPVFSSRGTKFAIGVCWDWHFPEMAAIYSLKGAEVLFAPHASPIVAGDRKEIWLRYLGARAYDNSVYLAACNQSGENGQGRVFSGGTLVLGPKGEVLAANQGNEELTVVTLAAESLNSLRRKSRFSMRDSFFLADRRKELYRELIELDVE